MKEEIRIPSYIKLLAFSLFAVYLFVLALRQSDINGIESTDSYFYLKIAQTSWEGISYTHRIYSPGYSWIISLFLNFFEDVELAGRFVSVIFSILSLVVAFLFIKRYFDDATAFFGTLSIAFIPKYIYYSVSTLPYTTSVFFLWFPLYMVYVGSRGFLFSFLAGILAGYGYIVRPENILSLLIFAFLSKDIRKILFFVSGFFISTLPYHIISIQEGNVPSILSKFIAYKVPQVGVVPEKVAEKSNVIVGKLLSFKEHIRYFLSNFHLAHKYSIPYLISSSLLVLFGIGLGAVIMNWNENKEKIKPFIIIFLLWIFPIFALVIVADYMFVPVLITFGAISGNFHRLVNRGKYVLFLAICFLNLFWASRPFYSDDGRKIYRITGRWVAENLGKNRFIFEPFPFATFYADGIWLTSPEKADIIILSSADIFSGRGKNMVMLFLSESDQNYKLVKKFNYRGVISKVFVKVETK